MVEPQREVIEVHLDAPELGTIRRIGMLSRETMRGHEVVSFAYDADWLTDGSAFTLDSSLALWSGEQFPAADRGQFGIFLDSAPDRWGRVLMERREAFQADREGRSARALSDWDFLLGVHDHARLGALRFRRGGNRPFLDDSALAAPPLARLRELEHSARELERPGAERRPEYSGWLALLLAPGSSLGGTRPKASFTDEDGGLWLAKFPSREDRRDVGAWEYLVHRLAVGAGIEVPDARLLRLSGAHRTFCVRRFDRTEVGRRMFASAMTLLGKRDGESDASYLDLALAIQDHGVPGRIEADLAQLFRRVVFNVMVGNRDDHLRNHGMLRVPGGWVLAPAFDVNPNGEKARHAISLDGSVAVPDLARVRATAPFYRLDATAAGRIVEEVGEVVSRWRRVARELDLPAAEITLVAPAFAPGEGGA
ncbi:MAG TPA: type II toxin-antitoxin system HipA family toxin [Rhodanobacteraceae bacterium]|nr:type II toxin-antitoxin system HipA family toxin [Rhodanobacteraceae bacterium]